MIIRRGNDSCLWYDYFIKSSEDKFGKEIYSFIENADNDCVKAFFQVYKKSKSEENSGLNFKIVTVNDFCKTFRFNQDDVEEELTIEQLISHAKELASGTNPNLFRIRPSSRKFIRQAGKEELKELAHIAVDEPSDFVKAALLHVFNFIDFPLDVGLLLPYATSENDELGEIIMITLSRIKDKRIHELAIQLFNDMQVENAVALLKANIETEDETLIRKYIMRSKRVTHGIIKSITYIYGKYKSNTCGNILLHLYKNAECTHCRYKIVETMINNAVIPKNILIECQYDSYEDTRSLR